MVGIAAMELVGWRGAYLGKRGSRSRRLRVRRLLLLLGAICLSPVLLPLVCLSSPIICALALCFRFGRVPSGAARADELARRCEEGAAGAPRGEGRLLLLHQYLEDQMGLVGAVVRDCCGGVDDDGDMREGC